MMLLPVMEGKSACIFDEDDSFIFGSEVWYSDTSFLLYMLIRALFGLNRRFGCGTLIPYVLYKFSMLFVHTSSIGWLLTPYCFPSILFTFVFGLINFLSRSVMFSFSFAEALFEALSMRDSSKTFSSSKFFTSKRF